MYEKLEPVDVFRNNYHHLMLMEYLVPLQVSSVVLLIVLIQIVLLLLQYVFSI